MLSALVPNSGSCRGIETRAPTGCNDSQVIRHGDGYLRIFVLLANKPGGNIEDRVSAALPGDLENHPPSRDDLAGFCSFRRHRSRDVRFEFSVREIVLCVLQSSLWRFDLRLRGLELLFVLIIFSTRRKSPAQELALPTLYILRIRQHGLRGSQI